MISGQCRYMLFYSLVLSTIYTMKVTHSFLLLFLLFGTLPLLAQEEDAGKLVISGSVDTYYKYDFSGRANIGTSFGDEQNSISIGMLDLVFEKARGKASFLGEIAFGPRNAASAGPATLLGTVGEGEGAIDVAAFAPRIQNLYVSYALTEKLTITGGYMGTFVGYEIISPTGNFNYSTSYLFTNGPFQNAGVKLDMALTEKIGLMVGAFNPWNVYTADPEIGPTSIGAQLSLSLVEGWDAYFNFITGKADGTEIDLTTTYQVNDALMVGLNAARYTNGADTATSFAGAALYLNYAVTSAAAIGLRYEYFSVDGPGNALGLDQAGNIHAITLSANIGSGDLIFIPEIRFDAGSADLFLDNTGAPTPTAGQVLLGAVYAF